MSDYSEDEQWERAKEWLKGNGLWIIAGIAIGASAAAMAGSDRSEPSRPLSPTDVAAWAVVFGIAEGGYYP